MICARNSFSGVVLDSLDYGTEQALKSGIQAVNVQMSALEQLPVPFLAPEVIWIPREKCFDASKEGKGTGKTMLSTAVA